MTRHSPSCETTGCKVTTRRSSQLVESYGAHALTLDHLGGLIGQFLGGDPAKAPEAPKFASPEHDRQALRLARLLNAYQEHLPPAELALLCRVCLLERSVKVDQMLPLFLCSPAVHLRTARELQSSDRAHADPRWSSAADLLASWRHRFARPSRSRFRRRRSPGRITCFEETVRQAVASILEKSGTTLEDDVEAVIRLYVNASSASRPSSALCRGKIRTTSARQSPGITSSAAIRCYRTRSHPPRSKRRFSRKAGRSVSPPLSADLTPGDVMHGASESEADIAAVRREASWF